MSVQSDLERAIAYCEVSKGTYALMAQSTEDQQAKESFNTMKSDIEKHIKFLSDRMEYLKQNNELIKEKK